MKLVITIPARNEEETIGEVIREIPEDIEGIDEVEIIIIDGASTDKTAELAKKAGATHVYSDHINRGLASAFNVGIQKALLLGADIIVNTDADMQYDQTEIPKLVKPIIDREADMVVGSRFEGWIEEMPLRKRIGNRLATVMTSLLAGQKLSDAQSGFRAIHRELAQRLIIESKKTYVQETLIRSIRAGYCIIEVPIRFRKRNDESRLIRNVWSYASSVFPDLVLTYAQVAPLRLFGGLSILLLAIFLPITLAMTVFSLSGALPLIWGLVQFLIPSLSILIGTGMLMDHQEKVRKWHIERKALYEKHSQE